MLKKIRGYLNNKWIFLGGLAGLGLLLQTFGVTKQPEPVRENRPGTVTAVPAGPCKPADGTRIYAGVKVYANASCRKLLGTILGTEKTMQMVKIHYTDGSKDWKQMKAVREQAFVSPDDPALKAKKSVTLPY
jgi:hypothetical protein